MADTDRIKRNLSKMIDQGAPEADLDGYLKSEGFSSADEWRAALAPKAAAPQVGVQDWEPTQPGERSVMERINTGVNWLGTRATKAGTALLGTPRALSDLTRAGLDSIGLTNFQPPDPVSMVARFLPSTQQMNDRVFREGGVPEVNAPGKGGKIVDAGTEAVLGAALMPGSWLRNALPAFTGGATQEFAGQLTEGTKWEPVARLGTGIVVGGATALTQNALGNVAQGTRNALAPNVDQTAGKIIGRALERDKTTGNALAAKQADLGPGAMVVEAGGPNVRGTLRGAIAAPGEARTNVQNAFDERILGSNSRTTTALDKAISPNNSLATTVDDLSALRAQQAAPKYEASGIPREIKMTETIRPGEPVKRMVPILPGAKAKTQITEPGPDVVERSFNSPNFSTPQLEYFIKNSPDVQAAIGAARRLPQFKDLPQNSMVMLDKAYKHLTGMEQEAIRAGNNTRAFDLKNLRQGFQRALTDANPKYQEALDAFSGPSKLIDSSTRAKEWFTKNVDPVIVGREYEAMKAAGLDDAALIGVRDWARTLIGRSDRGVAAERVWSGGDNRARLETILGPDGYKQLAKSMDVEKNAIATSRDIRVGSRTAPMMMEANDNAGQAVNALADVGRGRFGAAATRAIGALVDRIAEGKTEAVNAKIAEMLSSRDPKTVSAITAFLEQARLKEAARSASRRNALSVGGVASPAVNALAGADR